MPDPNSDQALMALLALEAEDSAVERDAAAPIGGPQVAQLPTLDQRVAMYLTAVHGPDAAITAEMRSAARDRLLTAMAADLADEMTGPLPAPRLPTVRAVRGVAAQSAVPMSAGLSRLWAGLVRDLQQLLSPAAAAFSIRGLRLAAVPLLALIVVGSVGTGMWMNDSANQGTNIGPTENAPLTRSLTPSSVPEQNLERAIAADEATLGPNHPAVARKLVDLADLYRQDGRYADAEALCTRALTIQQRALGPKNPETVRTLKELAAVYRAQGRNREADDLLSQANQH
jgi:Tetratricopeptide repeat